MKCICDLEVEEECNLDYTALWSYLALKRKEDGFYLMGHGDDLSVYKVNFVLNVVNHWRKIANKMLFLF